jgi:hypothetical protein
LNADKFECPLLADAVDKVFPARPIETLIRAKGKLYDWVLNDGYNNFSGWVDAAAKEAGR